MNNSKLAMENVSLSPEPKFDNTVQLREREQRLIHIIEAIQGIAATSYWSTLKAELFDDLERTLKSQLFTEAKKEVPDTLKQNRIAGQLKWAEKYSDLSKLESGFRLELQGIRQQLYGKQNE